VAVVQPTSDPYISNRTRCRRRCGVNLGHSWSLKTKQSRTTHRCFASPTATVRTRLKPKITRLSPARSCFANRTVAQPLEQQRPSERRPISRRAQMGVHPSRFNVLTTILACAGKSRPSGGLHAIVHRIAMATPCRNRPHRRKRQGFRRRR